MTTPTDELPRTDPTPAGGPLPSGRVTPVPVTAGYRLALAAVAFAMILLPLIYLAIVVLAAWGGYLYLVTVWPKLADVGNWQVRFLAGLGPPIAAAILVAFMLRSMWPRRSGRPDGLVVREREEPRLHELVRAVADALGAPRPREIRVDLQVNASAGLRRGLLSLFGRDLVLTIGLPLASGLTTSQLAGVIAHELGHFAQRGGMGVSYLIRSIQGWFARVVFERGDFDHGLREHAARAGWLAGGVAHVAAFFLWVSRRILHGLMYLGAALSATLSRQMEYDADRYEARLVGSRTANETSREMARLMFADRSAWSELATHWREGKLTDDVPALVCDHRERLPAEVVRRIDVARLEEDREWHASHPTFAERERSLLREPREGIFRDDRPASGLFADFARLCRIATIEEYRARLGPAFTPDRLIDLRDIARFRDQTEAESETFGRMFGAALSLRRPVRPDLDAAAPLGDAERSAALARLARESERERSALERANERCGALEERLDLLGAFAVLEELGVPRAQWGNPDWVAGHLGGAEGPATAAAQARRELESRLEPLARNDQAAGRRLALATAAARTAGRPGAEEAERCLRALAALEPSLTTLRRLRRDVLTLRALFSCLGGREKDRRYVESLESRYRDVQRGLEKLHRELHPLEHPLTADPKVRTMQQYALPDVPDADQPQAVVEAAEEAIERTEEARRRLLLHLAVLCEATERAARGQVTNFDEAELAEVSGGSSESPGALAPGPTPPAN